MSRRYEVSRYGNTDYEIQDETGRVVRVYGGTLERALTMAAAPAMREALEDLVERIEQWETDIRAIIKVDPKHGMDLTRARAALALAKGEVPT